MLFIGFLLLLTSVYMAVLCAFFKRKTFTTTGVGGIELSKLKSAPAPAPAAAPAPAPVGDIELSILKPAAAPAPVGDIELSTLPPAAAPAPA